MQASPIPTYTAAQVRAAEAPLLAAGEPLMARASAALAEIVGGVVDASGRDRTRILVLCGGGDNGGDALFAAAILARRADVEVDVLAVSDRAHPAGLAAALAAGARRVSLEEAVVGGHDLLLDGVLGIGAAGAAALRGAARDAVEALLPAVLAGRTRVVAVDLPSGLDPDTGAADEAVLPAGITVTFGAVKHGLAVGRGPGLAGEPILVDIGLGPALAGMTARGTGAAVRWTAGAGGPVEDPPCRPRPEGEQR